MPIIAANYDVFILKPAQTLLTSGLQINKFIYSGGPGNVYFLSNFNIVLMQPGTGTTVGANDATIKISASWNNYFRALTPAESVFTAWSCLVRNRITK